MANVASIGSRCSIDWLRLSLSRLCQSCEHVGSRCSIDSFPFVAVHGIARKLETFVIFVVVNYPAKVQFNPCFLKNLATKNIREISVIGYAELKVRCLKFTLLRMLRMLQCCNIFSDDIKIKPTLPLRAAFSRFQYHNGIGNHNIAQKFPCERVEEYTERIGSQDAEGNGYGCAKGWKEGEEGNP